MTIPFSLVSIVTSLRSLSRRAESDRELVNRPLQFQKCSQYFMGTDNETLSVVAIRVSNRGCSFFAGRVGFAEGIFQLITLTVIVLTAE